MADGTHYNDTQLSPRFEKEHHGRVREWRITLPNPLDELYIDVLAETKNGATFKLHHSTHDSVTLVCYMNEEQIEFIIKSLREMQHELASLPGRFDFLSNV